MKSGKPPLKFNKEKFQKFGDGLESKELHHTPIPKSKGGKEIIEVWPKEHEFLDEFRHTGY